MSLKLIKKWIKALRSDEYLQGMSVLVSQGKDGQHYFCCLGVAVNECLGGFDEVPEDYPGYGKLGEDDGYIPLYLRKKLGLTSDMQETLVRLNDREGYTFEQIADYIEENYL